MQLLNSLVIIQGCEAAPVYFTGSDNPRGVWQLLNSLQVVIIQGCVQQLLNSLVIIQGCAAAPKQIYDNPGVAAAPEQFSDNPYR